MDLNQDEIPVQIERTLVGVKEERIPQIHYADGLVQVKHEKEIIVPDEDGLIRIKKEEVLDPYEGSEGSLNQIKKSSLSGLEADQKKDVESELVDNKILNKCSNCDYKTNFPNHFKRHKQKCIKVDNYFKCPHCDYKSLKISHLKTHVASRHTNEKPYECHHCQFKSARPTTIKRHIMARHTGEKPNKCSHCDFETIQNYTLKKHIMACHTGEKPHHCLQCNYKTLYPSDLKKHIMVHHTGEKPNKCLYCDYRAVRRTAVKRHMESHHAISQKAPKNAMEPKRKASKTESRMSKDCGSKISKLTPKTMNNAVKPKRQLPKHRNEGKRRRTSPRITEPVLKNPKEMKKKSNTQVKAAIGCKVAIVPNKYPLTQLSLQQLEILKEIITDKLDAIDEEQDDHPLFNGISYKTGGCIILCDDEASRTWLSKVIPDITIESDITLRIADVGELVTMTEVSSFFPGKKMSEEALLKRLRVQNTEIKDIRSWSLHSMKPAEKGFFAVLRIPKTSLSSLKAQSMQVGYGLGKVTFKHEEDLLGSPTCED